MPVTSICTKHIYINFIKLNTTTTFYKTLICSEMYHLYLCFYSSTNLKESQKDTYQMHI